MAREVRAVQRHERINKMVQGFLGKIPTAPAKMLAKTRGAHWVIPKEEQEEIGQIMELWLEERFDVDLADKPWMLDVLLLAMLVRSYAPAIAEEMRLKREKIKKGKKRGDNSNPGVSGDGQELPGQQSPPSLLPPGSDRPPRRT